MDLTGERDAKVAGAKKKLKGRGFFYELPEFVLFLKAFDFPSAKEKWIYAGACVDTRRVEGGFPFDKLPADKKIIYISLGTHVFFYPASEHFFKTVMCVAGDNPDLFFVVGVGRGRNLDSFASLVVPVPSNAVMEDFIPQLAMLEKASLMITNGGLGTVKECIQTSASARDFLFTARHA